MHSPWALRRARSVVSLSSRLGLFTDLGVVARVVSCGVAPKTPAESAVHGLVLNLMKSRLGLV